MSYVNAGQNPPILVKPSGRSSLSNSGLPVAILPGVHARTPLECRLEAGDLLLMASDGVTEFNHEGVQYDEGRFQAFLDRAGNESAEATGQALLDDLAAWSEGKAADDDVTLLVVRRN